MIFVDAIRQMLSESRQPPAWASAVILQPAARATQAWSATPEGDVLTKPKLGNLNETEKKTQNNFEHAGDHCMRNPKKKKKNQLRN